MLALLIECAFGVGVAGLWMLAREFTGREAWIERLGPKDPLPSTHDIGGAP